MGGFRHSCVHWPTTCVFLFGFAASVYSAGWSDDFNDGNAKDGNPVTWIEDLGGLGYFPGVYDASSGDYVLNPDDGPFGPISVSFVGVSFTDTYIRTQGIIMPDPLEPLNNGGNFVLLGRVNPQTLDSYLLYVDVNDNGGGTLELQWAPGGAATGFNDPLAEVELDFGGGTEIILELNIVGDQLSGYAWQPGQSKPATPQVTHTDSTFTSGLAGVAYQEDDANTFSIHRYVSAQDTPFVDTLPGDYNGNGTVDAADYVMWREGINADPGQAGYDLWKQNFGNGAPGGAAVGAAAVPEPVGLILMLAGIATAGMIDRRLCRRVDL